MYICMYYIIEYCYYKATILDFLNFIQTLKSSMTIMVV